MKASYVVAALVVIALVAGAAFYVLSQGPTPDSTTSKDVRQIPAGGVTISALYKGGGVFNVALDTHAGSLDYRMDSITYVRDAAGNVYRPLSWDGGSGGHHISGALKFPSFDDAGGFVLAVDGVGGSGESVLQW